MNLSPLGVRATAGTLRAVEGVVLQHTRTGMEPIRTMAEHRLVGRKILFAVNLIPDTTGQISIGDSVEVC